MNLCRRSAPLKKRLPFPNSLFGLRPLPTPPSPHFAPILPPPHMSTLAKLVEAASHPGEVVPLVKMALAARRARALPQGEALAFCYGMLNRVSRR